LLEVTLRLVTLSARRTGATLAIGALALTSAACGSSSKSGASGAGGATTGGSSAATSGSAVASASGKAAPSSAGSAAPSVSGKAAPSSSAGASGSAPAAALPKSITIGTDASYAPIESFASNHKTIVGVDPDLGAALGKELGIQVKFVNAKFDGLVAGVQSGRYDLAMSAMTDNPTREKTVDFVDYFSAGTSFMIKKGGKTVNTVADLCGRKVAVEKGTTQLDDATAQGKKCKLTVLPFDDQSGANLALSSGRADVVMADSPVNAYAAQQSKGAFAIVGQTYGTAPYGIAVPKKSTALRDALVGALNKMIADGSYKTLLTKWGVQAGALDKAAVNGGASS
jgi:polar amino acid transport system substrate-binding protein